MSANNTKFTRRRGGYKFREATQTNGYASLVNNWHKNVYDQLDVQYRFKNHGTEHQPDWEATPTIMGEEHPDYAGRGSSQPKAREASAKKIANSGHCPGQVSPYFLREDTQYVNVARFFNLASNFRQRRHPPLNMVLPEDLQAHIDLLNGHLEKLTADGEDKLDDRHHSSEKKLLKIFRDACAFVRVAVAKNSPHLAEIVENVQILLDKGVEYAYGDSHLFEFLPSWAHSDTSGQPMVLDTTEGRVPFPKIVYDARCEVQSSWISEPIHMDLSPGNACLATIGMGGYKQRAPHLEYYLLDESETISDFPPTCSVMPGLEAVATHLAFDETRRLIFVADKNGVKSFAWTAPTGEIYPEGPHPAHTLASDESSGPLAVLPNGTILRTGVGRVSVWNIDSLATHGKRGKRRIGVPDKSIRERSWRDDPEAIEVSFGSFPTSFTHFTGHPDLMVGRRKPLIQAPSTMLCKTSRSGCATIDMEH
ncbi:hypothetical protein FRC09_013037 [Ceratobasidium sp. 395]|nr:hypothetical protein FRC09_013037 [Ceratobasidium sp. 395]